MVESSNSGQQEIVTQPYHQGNFGNHIYCGGQLDNSTLFAKLYAAHESPTAIKALKYELSAFDYIWDRIILCS